MHRKRAQKKCTRKIAQRRNAQNIYKKNAKKSLIEAREQKKCTEKVHRKFHRKNAKKKNETKKIKIYAEKSAREKHAYKKCTQWLVAASR